jgi:hypothetical protein
LSCDKRRAALKAAMKRRRAKRGKG